MTGMPERVSLHRCLGAELVTTAGYIYLPKPRQNRRLWSDSYDGMRSMHCKIEKFVLLISTRGDALRLETVLDWTTHYLFVLHRLECT